MHLAEYIPIRLVLSVHIFHQGCAVMAVIGCPSKGHAYRVETQPRYIMLAVKDWGGLRVMRAIRGIHLPHPRVLIALRYLVLEEAQDALE